MSDLIRPLELTPNDREFVRCRQQAVLADRRRFTYFTNRDQPTRVIGVDVKPESFVVVRGLETGAADVSERG